MNTRFQSAVDDGRLAGAVTLATNLSGTIDIEEAYGVKTLKNAPGANPPLTADTPMRMASCTKLLTAILILQAQEKGLLKLNDVVGDKLPEVAAMKVLVGSNAAGEPILEEPKRKITLTDLLTHSSGLSYAAFNPALSRWVPLYGGAPTVAENFNMPLTFHPGESWIYGPGCDWAGKYLEAVTGSSLEALLQEGICRPLGVNITFKLQSHPEMLATRGDVSERDPETGRMRFADRALFHKDTVDCHGGDGAFMSPKSFFAVLTSILHNDSKLLSPSSRARLFEDSLPPAAQRGMKALVNSLADWKLHGPVDAAPAKSWALGGLLFLEGSAAGRRRGSLSWSGQPCQFWGLDPAAGVAWVAAFHAEPWTDKVCFGLCEEFEGAVYAAL